MIFYGSRMLGEFKKIFHSQSVQSEDDEEMGNGFIAKHTKTKSIIIFCRELWNEINHHGIQF